MGRDNGSLDTLKPQPGQYDSYHHKSHPLPGVWAQEQMNASTEFRGEKTGHTGKQSTEIQRAIAEERAQHEYWEKWQGVQPGKPVYEDPRAWQNTLLPNAKYGTEGRGYS